MKLIKSILAIFVCVCLSGSSVLAHGDLTQTDVSEITVLNDTLDERVVEVKEEKLLHRVTYDKIGNKLVNETFENGEKIQSFVIDLDYSENRSGGAKGAAATAIQSETGFGYVCLATENVYSCSHELVENGTYPYHAINLLLTSIPTIQSNFRNHVDDLIEYESDYESAFGSSSFFAVIAIIAYCLGNPSVGYAANIEALGLSISAKNLANKMNDMNRTLASEYSQMYPYRK